MLIYNFCKQAAAASSVDSFLAKQMGIDLVEGRDGEIYGFRRNDGQTSKREGRKSRQIFEL